MNPGLLRTKSTVFKQIMRGRNASHYTIPDLLGWMRARFLSEAIEVRENLPAGKCPWLLWTMPGRVDDCGLVVKTIVATYLVHFEGLGGLRQG